MKGGTIPLKPLRDKYKDRIKERFPRQEGRVVPDTPDMSSDVRKGSWHRLSDITPSEETEK